MSSQLKYYTYYLLNGQRKVFMGISQQDAYLNNQSYTDGQQAIMLIEEGISDRYYWKNQSWNNKEILYLTEKPAIILPHVFDYRSEVHYAFENKDILYMSLKWGHFSLGWVQYKEVGYASYQQGSYDGSDMDDHHYITSGIQYFDPSHTTQAIKAFMERMGSDKPQSPTDTGISLQNIRDLQSPDTIYGDMSDPRKIWLLGSLLKRLDLLAIEEGMVFEGFIRIDRTDSPTMVEELFDQIQYYCDQLLITHTGKRNREAESLLTKHFHYRLSQGEVDGFGELTMCIHLNSGKLIYG